MNNCLFVGFSRIFLLWILIFKGLTARRLYKSFGVKGLIVLIPNYPVVTLVCTEVEMYGKKVEMYCHICLEYLWNAGSIAHCQGD
jgi:hypothetical protein